MTRPTRSRALELMAYADGELDAAHAARLEAELARDPEAARMVEAFVALGARMRRDHGAAPDLTDAIMARVAADAARLQAPAPAATVLDLQAARARRVKIGAAVASLAAAAAAAALWIARPMAEGAVGPGLAAAALGVQVQQVDADKVQVFSIPALHSNASSVVVWLGDEEDDATEPAAQPDAASGSTP